MHDDWRKRLAAEIERQGRDMKEVSRAAGLGETYVRDSLKRQRGGKIRYLQKIEAALGKPSGWLTQDETTPQSTSPGRSHAFKPDIVSGDELVGARTFPIYAAAMGGAGNMMVTFDPIEYARTPSILEGVKNAYGIRVVGESMEPAFEQGDMALVHPHLQPERNTDVVLYDSAPDGTSVAMIKRLVSWDERVWRLRQYNPPLEFEVFRADWPVCHRIVGKYTRR